MRNINDSRPSGPSHLADLVGDIQLPDAAPADVSRRQRQADSLTHPSTTVPPSPRPITAERIYAHSAGYIRIHSAAMQALGANARTFAAVRELTDKKTRRLFYPHEDIAVKCGLRLRTVRKHLEAILDHGWLVKIGREKRRTVTYEIPQVTWDTCKSSGFAPLFHWWFGTPCNDTWSATAVYLSIVARLHEWEKTVEKQYKDEADETDLQKLDHLQVIRCKDIQKDTNLKDWSVRAAFTLLQSYEFISRTETPSGQPTFQLLMPRKRRNAGL